MLLENGKLEELCDQASNQLIAPLTEYLRTLAYTSGWPAHLIQGLSVNTTNDYTLYVDTDPEKDEEIGDLEYGALNSLPNAVIRPFTLRAPAVAGQILEQDIIPKLLYDLGLL